MIDPRISSHVAPTSRASCAWRRTPAGLRKPDGHDHADELVRLAVGRLQRVELRHPRVLRGVQLREHLVQRLLEREVPVLLVVVHGAATLPVSPRGGRPGS